MNIYRIGKNGLQDVTIIDSDDKKNNLPIGTVVELHGYDYPKYVIVKNEGISEKFRGYGARYRMVKIEDFSFRSQDAFSMKHISHKSDNRIQMYYTDEVWDKKQVDEIYEKALQVEKEKQEEKEQASKVAAEKEARGRQLFEKYIPEDAQALIIAELEVDNCDLATDYFATSIRQTVILGWSKHKRDLFSEMRKHADRIPETAHLKTPPDVNNNNEQKTEANKSWWHPRDEHREKYSMGKGYYLKDGGGYSTGWLIKKCCRYKDWSSGLYISMAERCIFEEQKQDKKKLSEV